MSHYGTAMSLLADDSAVMAKTKELCETISTDATFTGLMSKVEAFLSNDEARTQYQSVGEQGEALHQKQHAGVELDPQEITDFEQARANLMENPIANSFLQARQELEGLHQTISKYIGMTLELGRTPTPEDFAAAEDGCCGGGEAQGGGCGCA